MIRRKTNRNIHVVHTHNIIMMISKISMPSPCPGTAWECRCTTSFRWWSRRWGCWRRGRGSTTRNRSVQRGQALTLKPYKKMTSFDQVMAAYRNKGLKLSNLLYGQGSGQAARWREDNIEGL